MLKKTIIFFTAVAVAYFVMPAVADALTVTPAIREMSLTPGEEKTALIELKNDSQEALKLETEVTTFTAKDGSGEAKFDFDTPATGAAEWVSVDQSSFIMEADETMQAAVTFDVPAEAVPGGHYVAVFFNFSQSAMAEDDNSLNIESKVGTLFLLTVTGDYKESGAISTFNTVGGSSIYTDGPIDFNLTFQNTGDVHLEPTGKMVIKNMFGNTVKEVTINENGSATLPGNMRKYEVAGWDNIGNAFGKYTGEVNLTASAVKDTATVSFWVFSVTGIVIAGVVVVVVIVFIVVLAKVAGKKSDTSTV